MCLLHLYHKYVSKRGPYDGARLRAAMQEQLREAKAIGASPDVLREIRADQQRYGRMVAALEQELTALKGGL